MSRITGPLEVEFFFPKNSKNSNQFFEKFRKISKFFKKTEKYFYYTICTFLAILKLFEHGKAIIGLLLCPKSIKKMAKS
jgi:hypothetical protein